MNKTISVESAQNLLDSEQDRCILVDVRSTAEFNSLHAQPAVHIPLENITAPETLAFLKQKKVLCICQSGMRGKKAVDALSSAGISEVTNVEGGTTAWHNAHLPTIEGKRSISIERQVRIAAGALVFLGSLAALFISSYFLAIPVFVGAGLVFAGVTDTCGMAMLLARCPWNSK